MNVQRVPPPGWLTCGAVAALAFVAYAPSLDNGFSLDDYNWLARAHFAPSQASFLFEPEPGEIVSPVAKVFLIVGARVFGQNPLGWHVALVLLHMFNAVLVYRLGERLFADHSVALLAACFFATAASGSEAVFWVAAYAHLLATALYLITLLLFLRCLEGRSHAGGWGALGAFSAGLLTKASFYTAWVALALAPSTTTAGRRGRLLIPFAVLLAAGVILNAALALGQSYLVSRGIYASGWHVVTNLGEFLARIVFPFRAVLVRIGLEGAYAPLLSILAVGAPLGAAVVVAFADRRARFAVVFVILTLAPFLPFIYDPTSRYTYLATAGWSWLAALLCVRAARRFRSGVLIAALACLYVAAQLAEIVLEDNEYEYRERLMSALIADVRGIYPEVPGNDTITVLDLPRLGIDRGIHLQAALALAYGEPDLVLIAPEPGSTVAGDVLVYTDGRIRRR